MSEKAAPKLDAAPVMNRWLVVVGAILIQLCLGAIYAWSVFTPPLAASDAADVAGLYSPAKLGMDAAAHKQMTDELAAPKKLLTAADKKNKDDQKAEPDQTKRDAMQAAFEKQKASLQGQMDDIAARRGAKDPISALKYGLNNTQIQGIFAAGLALFAIVMVIAGRIMPKVGPQKLAIAGGVVLGVGYALAGLIAPGSFWSTFVFVGLIGGAGIGLGYVVPIAVGMKWFPDKKGLITGIAVAGFGFGATLWVALAGNLGPITTGQMIRFVGLPTTFIVYGAAFLVLCVVGATWMKNPPAGWLPAGYTPPQKAAAGQKHVAGTVDFTSGHMLATPQFYMIFLCFVFGAGAGLMSIGLMKAFPIKLLTDAGMSPTAASATAGMAMGVFFALANGIGRIAWGTLSDRIGRKLSIIVMMATQGVFVILFQWMAGMEWTLYVFCVLIGFNFGGNFALFPTITADTFGTKYIGQNYGWVFLSYGVGGIFGPMLGGVMGDAGAFPTAFTISGICVLIAAGLIALVHPPQHPEAVSATAGEHALEVEAEAEIDGAASKKPR